MLLLLLSSFVDSKSKQSPTNSTIQNNGRLEKGKLNVSITIFSCFRIRMAQLFPEMMFAFFITELSKILQLKQPTLFAKRCTFCE